MLEKLKNLFSFSKNERRGIYVLLTIIFLQIIILKAIPYFYENKALNFSDFENQINDFYHSQNENSEISQNDSIQYFSFDPNSVTDSSWLLLGFSDKQIKTINNFKSKGGKFFKKEDLAKMYCIPKTQYQKLEPYIEIENQYQQRTYYKKEYTSNYKKEEKVKDDWRKAELFDFNPNTVDEFDMQRLGFTEKQIKVIANFRTKGGKFYKKEDLKKIYSIPEEQYNYLEPNIKIEQNTVKPKFAKKEFRNVEINSADTSELVYLPSIGASFAKRIIKYRERLGGFLRSEQLYEVFGFNDELYTKVKPYVSIDTTRIKKININTATYSDFSKHPYFKSETIKTILQARKIQKNFKSIEELKKYKILHDTVYVKIKNYIKVK